MEYSMPVSSLLIKPAGPDCNMNCGYCFYLEKSEFFQESEQHRMSDKVLKEMIKQAMAGAGPQISFGWQGGEPTLMGLDFFKQAVEYQKEFGAGRQVSNGLQTNGLLLDDDWAEFLAEYQFLIGLSIDGPEHIHDHYRRTKAGGPTWQQVADRSKMLLEKGVLVNAISVVNDYSVQFPEELYNYYKEIGLTFMQFIPCVELDPLNLGKKASFAVDPQAYGNFLKILFDLWWNDFDGLVPTTSIRFFEGLFHAYVDAPPAMCTLQQECGTYLVVEHNGEAFSCDFFVDDLHKLGNIFDKDISTMLNSVKQGNFGKAKGFRHSDCQECPWLKYCWGGCPKDRLNNPAEDGLSYLCSSYKELFAHAHERMADLAEKWLKEHGPV